MPLCTIIVDEFKFDNPKISWSGTNESIVHSTKESHTILLNTIYDAQISKTLQKFNGTDWTDVADINTSYNITYDGEGTDKYRLKASKGQKVLFSNELAIVKLLVVPIEFDGDPTESSNVCIRFTKDLPSNVASYTLVVVSGTTSQRYPNTQCFQDNNSITGVYIEYEYSDGYKADSNTLKVVRPTSLEINWQGGGTENREGYASGVVVEASLKGVLYQIYNETGQWVNASFSGGWINMPEGVNKIRAVLPRYNLTSNVLVYRRHPKITLHITWDNGTVGNKVVNEDTDLVIKLKPGYLESGIKNKQIKKYIYDGPSLDIQFVNVDDVSNMSYRVERDNIQFKMIINYNDGSELESNTLVAYKLKIPKITWTDNTDQPRSGSWNNIQIDLSNTVGEYYYALQTWFRKHENDTTENWQDVVSGSDLNILRQNIVGGQGIINVNTFEQGWYKFRVVATYNPQLVSNVLEYRNIPRVRRGTISWKGTSDKIIYNDSTPIVVQADAPEDGGSYWIAVTTYSRNYRNDYPQEVSTSITGFRNESLYSAGFLSETQHNTVTNIGIVSSIATHESTGTGQGEGTTADTSVVSLGSAARSNLINDNNLLHRNVNHNSEVDIRTSEYVTITYGLHYFSLVYNNGRGETYEVGERITAIIRNNTLAIHDYVYEDKWGISKQTADHPQTRWETKSSWSNEKSAGFIDHTLNVDDEFITHAAVGLNYKPNKTLQKQRLNETQWTDVSDIPLSNGVFTKEEGIVKYRLKSQLHNNEIEYSNEVYTFYFPDILKFDTDKYYIVENVFNKNDKGKYNSIENNHTISINFIDTFTYQYQILVNRNSSGFDYRFENVGNTFTHDNPLTFEDIFRDGYPNGIVLIRLECSTTLDKTIRWSNLIYAFFNAAALNWMEDDHNNVLDTFLVGASPYTFSIADIYKYTATHRNTTEEDNGELKIYINKTNPEQKTYQQIIDQNDVIDTKEQAEDFTKSIDPNIDKPITYSFTFSWVNSFGITHKGRSVINATLINPVISIRAANTIRIPYEVKTNYPEAADIYYDYQNPTVVLHKHINNPNMVYTLERSNLDSEEFTQEYVLPNRDNGDTEGDYVIDRTLSQGKYRMKLTINNTKHIYSDEVTLYSFIDILKVNNTYALFGFNNTTATSGYDNQTEYNITYNLESYPENFRFKIQWCHSLTRILCSDTVHTIGDKKVMSMNAFVDIGNEFSKSDSTDIKQVVGRHNGLVRIRLKVLDGENIIGYSNVIWIYLDNTVSHFVSARVGNEDTTFPLYIEGESANGRLQRLISSTVFAIQVKNQYPDQKSDIYMSVWNGRNYDNKYEILLGMITGNGAYGNRNRTPNVYLYHRKTIIAPFNITLIPIEEPLEQVVITAELINEQRFIVEEVLYGPELRGVIHSSSGSVLTMGTSSTKGNFRTIRYNNGSVDLPFEFVLYESTINTEQWSKYSGELEQVLIDFDGRNVIQIPTTINVNNTVFKQRKFEYTSNRSIKNKIRIKYKNRYIAETNAVSFYYFEPMISMVENRRGNDAISFIYTTRQETSQQRSDNNPPRVIQTHNTVFVYANNIQPGFAYRFQIKKLDEPSRTIIIPDPTGEENHLYSTKGSRFITQEGFNEFVGNFFTSNDKVRITKERPDVDRNKYYALRLAIYNSRRDTLIGYSNVVYFENDDFYMFNG